MFVTISTYESKTSHGGGKNGGNGSFLVDATIRKPENIVAEGIIERYWCTHSTRVQVSKANEHAALVGRIRLPVSGTNSFQVNYKCLVSPKSGRSIVSRPFMHAGVEQAEGRTINAVFA